MKDPEFLRRDQYRDDANLSARVALHVRFSVNRHGWQRWVFERLALPPGARVLEVGCGPGNLWTENAERLDPGLRLTLSDLSAGMLAVARGRLGALSIVPRVDWAVADAQALPFADGAFDVAIANHMLYHAPDLSRALGEIRRVLRDDGALCAATNGFAHMRELDDLLATVDPDVARDESAAAFGLETGAEHLRRHFSAVDLHVYPDALEVTDAGAVIRYLRSAPSGAGLDDEQAERIAALVNTDIATRGSFHVTKSTGLFECRG